MKGMRDKVGIFGELWLFMRYRKKYWIGAIMVVLALLGLLVVFAQGSALAPFIYALSKSTMHTTAMQNAALFFDTYAPFLGPGRVLDIGAQDVNGSLKQVCPDNLQYTGVDFVPGRGVDVVLDDPYVLPFDTESIDAVISSSCFEHSQLFWVLFLELLRVLKPSGLLYLNVPSNGLFHRYPVDCWRFYPDSGGALVEWGRRNGTRCHLLESFVAKQNREPWNDFVAVFLKDAAYRDRYPQRILGRHTAFFNGVTDASPAILQPEGRSQDLLFRAPTRPARSVLEKLRSRFGKSTSLT